MPLCVTFRRLTRLSAHTRNKCVKWWSAERGRRCRGWCDGSRSTPSEAAGGKHEVLVNCGGTCARGPSGSCNSGVLVGHPQQGETCWNHGAPSSEVDLAAETPPSSRLTSPKRCRENQALSTKLARKTVCAAGVFPSTGAKTDAFQQKNQKKIKTLSSANSSVKWFAKVQPGWSLGSQHERGVDNSRPLALELSCVATAECAALLVGAGAGAVCFFHVCS